MNEGYPQGQEKQFLTQDVQLPREGGDVQVTEPTSVEENGDTDTRWDKNKATTMAAVLQGDEFGNFDTYVKERDALKQSVDSAAFEDDYTQPERQDLHEAGENLADHVANPGRYEATVGDLEKKLAVKQNNYDRAVVKAGAKGQRFIDVARDRLERTVDQVLSPYQEIYDMNPALFAEMPTKEFMVIAKELAEISDEIEINEDNSNRLEWYNHKLKDAFENKSSVNWGIMDNFRQDICRSLGMENDDTYDRVLEKFEAEASDSFDKTPRQIMEGYIRVAGEYTSQFEAKKLADEQRKKDFLDKYKPETSDQDQN
ncbi:hypothetical protein H7Y29_01370 [Microbacteriaceae bacterium]|nr:hypothetical protein [Candidatus Saccharibacteria bacterium]